MRIRVRRLDTPTRGFASRSTRALTHALLTACAVAACQMPPVTRERVQVHIPDSASLDVVADSLAARGIVSSMEEPVRRWALPS